MKKSAFKFGPLQRKWLRALESGKFKRTVSVLQEEINGKFYYCCLGVANEVCELGEESYGSLVNTHEKLGLYTSTGEPYDYTTRKLILSRPSLTDLNDVRKLPFKKIAAHLRKNPEQYFSHSA